MRTLRPLAAPALSVLSLVACARPSTAPGGPPPAHTDGALSDADAPFAAAPDAVAPDTPAPESDAAVRARPLARAASAAPDAPWSAVASLTPFADSAALRAHVRAVSEARAAEQRRLAEQLRQQQLLLQRQQPVPLSPSGPQPTAVAAQAAGAAVEASTRVVAERRIAAAPAARAANDRGRSAPADSNSITNNQVANVDEGDIVKAAGDDLIVLRRGHLFRVSTANNTLRRVGHTPAFAPGTPPGDWYDELLVDGDIALVLGYSYRHEATEVNRFRLEPGGAIRYLDSFYLRSSDYFSADNYATRLVNGRFVMYVPIELSELDDGRFERSLPAVRLGRGGAFQSVLDFHSVFAADGDRAASTLHAVLTCDVHAARVGCSAHGVMASSSRTFYVSNTAVYVWSQSDRAYGDDRPSRSWIVRMPHDTAERAGAAQIHGGPVDQFAFDEREGALHVLLRAQSEGDAMWMRAGARGGVAALRIPVARMVESVSEAPREAYTVLVDRLGDGEYKQRWVGEYALFASSPYAYRRYHPVGRYEPIEQREPVLYAFRARDQRLFELRTEQRVERIEPLGQQALVVGNHRATLVLSPIALDAATPEIFAPVRIENSAQGESRSHGFFFRPSGPRDGVFGIATHADSRDGEGAGSSDVSFFRMTQLSLSRLGTIDAHPTRDQRCRTSCYDWYGNTRPIFWGERVFALMGDELVETALGASTLRERRRIDYGVGVLGVQREDEVSPEPF